MNLVKSFHAESNSFDAAVAADRLISDLLDSGIFDDRSWFTDEETYLVANKTVWYVSRTGSVSVSSYDDTEEEESWARVCSGTCFDRLYVTDGSIRHTGRSQEIVPPDMIVIID